MESISEIHSADVPAEERADASEAVETATETEAAPVEPDAPAQGEDAPVTVVPEAAEPEAVQPEDVAAAVRFLVELHPRARVPELVITPTVDDFF